MMITTAIQQKTSSSIAAWFTTEKIMLVVNVIVYAVLIIRVA